MSAAYHHLDMSCFRECASFSLYSEPSSSHQANKFCNTNATESTVNTIKLKQIWFWQVIFYLFEFIAKKKQNNTFLVLTLEENVIEYVFNSQFGKLNINALKHIKTTITPRISN